MYLDIVYHGLANLRDSRGRHFNAHYVRRQADVGKNFMHIIALNVASRELRCTVISLVTPRIRLPIGGDQVKLLHH